MKPVKIVKDSLGRVCENAYYIEPDGKIEFYIEFDDEEQYNLVVEAAEIKGISPEKFVEDCILDFSKKIIDIMEKKNVSQECL